MTEYRTRKVQPTDTHGEKVRVTFDGQTRTVPWDYGTNHMHAAAVLAVSGESFVHRLPKRDHTRGYVFASGRGPDPWDTYSVNSAKTRG